MASADCSLVFLLVLKESLQVELQFMHGIWIGRSIWDPSRAKYYYDCCACSASIITTEYTGQLDNTAERYNSTACPCR